MCGDGRKRSAALPQMMPAWEPDAFGRIEQLHLSSIPVPAPRIGEVLVKVGAAGVGPPGCTGARRKGGLAVTLPVTLGAEPSGGPSGRSGARLMTSRKAARASYGVAQYA